MNFPAMKCKTFLLFFILGTQISTAVPLYIFNLVYESPTLVGPAFVLVLPGQDKPTTQFGMTGWTLFTEADYEFYPDYKLGGRLQYTPLNSHGANSFYRNGIRDHSRDFKNASLLGLAFLRVRHNDHWNSKASLLVLKEIVSDVSTGLERFWQNPYAGLALEQKFQWTRSDDPFYNRWDGIKITGWGESYTGDENWWRTEISAGWGRHMHSFHLMGKGTFFYGENLNQISKPLAGSSWEVQGINTMYGYHYAEFRLNNVLLTNGSLDYELTRNWEWGVRGSWLIHEADVTAGYAVQLSTQYNGIFFKAGASASHNTITGGDWDRVIIFGGITAGFM